MTLEELTEQIKRGLFEAKRDNTLAALLVLERYADTTKNPEILAWYGYCLARERKSVREGLNWCLKALKFDPRSSSAYLCMGKIYLQAGKKKSALKAFNRGLTYGQNPALYKELQKLGTRKPPVFPFIDRDNPLNVYSGRLLSKLNLR
jgi:tetratricopeptide (TPR) repeat protein